MNRRTLLPAARLLTAAVAASALAIALPPRAATGQDRSWDRYRVLVERNIFLRDRRPARPRGSSRPIQRVVRDSDRDIVLTGIGRRDGETVAFFENTATGVTTRTSVGQAVGKGRARSITLDVVDYERDGSVSRIEIGYALQGGRFVRETVAAGPPATTRPGEPSGSTTGPAAETRPAPSGSDTKTSDIADILKRMRQRREQELRK